MMHYYRIMADDQHYAARWHLGEPLTENGDEIDAREFRYGQPYEGPLPTHVPISYEGDRVAFLLSAFDMPIVSDEVADVIQEIAPHDVQRFPITVGEYIYGYEILNAIRVIDCVDEQLSGFTKWGPGDGRDDKIGQYRHLGPLVIDPQRTGHHHVLRIKGSLVELIVSDEIVRALEGLPDLGIVFKQVTRCSSHHRCSGVKSGFGTMDRGPCPCRC